MVSTRVAKLYDQLPTHPHILDLARRVYPTWLTAHGHKGDRGLDSLAREIALCIIAIENGREEQGEDMAQRFVVGPGIIVTGSGLALENYQVAVIAGEAFGMHIDLLWPETEPKKPKKKEN